MLSECKFETQLGNQSYRYGMKQNDELANTTAAESTVSVSCAEPAYLKATWSY